MLLFKFFILSILILISYAQNEGESCTKNGVPGVCTPLRKCPAAIADSQNVQVCGKQGNLRIVCCTNTINKTRPNDPNECEPIPPQNLKLTKTGKKAIDKCIDWAEYINPCKKSSSLLLAAGKVRVHECHHNVNPLIVGGTEALPNEFPHMALLGYDSPKNSIIWSCSGTLISERWILTAGHCIYNRETDSEISHVKLGGKDRDAITPAEQQFTVSEIVAHPQYTGSSVYNDIALLKLDRNVKLGGYIIPACLDVGNVNDYKVMGTGWGATYTDGESSKQMLKVVLERYDFKKCSEIFPSMRRMRDGLRNSTQLCAGHHTESKDTCQGDSGGPLQVYNQDVRCAYTIMGVTSAGKICGVIDIPGLFTRVSAFVEWIENVVWP